MISLKNKMLVAFMVLGISYIQGAEPGGKRLTDDNSQEGWGGKRLAGLEESSCQDRDDVFKESTLSEFIRLGNIKELEAYFKQFQKDMKKRDFVHRAVLEDSLDSLKYFVEVKGLSLTDVYRGIAPFHFAKSKAVIDYFLDNGVDVNVQDDKGNTILFYLLKQEKFDLIGYLVFRGADVSLKNNEGLTASDRVKTTSGTYNKVAYDHFRSCESQFNRAVAEGLEYLAAVAKDSSQDRDDVFNEKTFYNIIRSGDIKELEAYFKQFQKDMEKRDFVHRAVLENSLGSLKYFVEVEKLSLTDVYRGIAPFHFAKSQDVIDYFLDHGVDVNVQDDKGNTILFYLAKSGHMDLVSYVVSRGVDPSLKNNRDKTARDCLIEKYTDHHFIDLDDELENFDDAVAKGLRDREKQSDQGGSA